MAEIDPMKPDDAGGRYTMKRRAKQMMLGTAAALATVLVAIQFVPVERANPPVSREVAWDSPGTRELAQRACYDCHSNETVWPWYSRVAPASWLVAKDVDEGREHLNFSEWDGPNEGLDEMVETIESGAMPLKPYVMLHPEAALSQREITELIRGLRKTFAADPPAEDAHAEDEHADEHD